MNCASSAKAKPGMQQELTARELHFADNGSACALYGELNRNLLTLEKGAGVVINARGTTLRITGSAHAVELTAELLGRATGKLACAGLAAFAGLAARSIGRLTTFRASRGRDVGAGRVVRAAGEGCVERRTGRTELRATAWGAGLTGVLVARCGTFIGEVAVGAFLRCGTRTGVRAATWVGLAAAVACGRLLSARLGNAASVALRCGIGRVALA